MELYYSSAKVSNLLNSINKNFDKYDTIIDETSTANMTYIWKAKIWSSASDWVWQIMRIDESWTNTNIWYADNTKDFVNIWDNRTSYTYSK